MTQAQVMGVTRIASLGTDPGPEPTALANLLVWLQLVKKDHIPPKSVKRN